MRVCSQSIVLFLFAKLFTNCSPRFSQNDSPNTLKIITTSLQLKLDLEKGSAHSHTSSQCNNCLTIPYHNKELIVALTLFKALESVPHHAIQQTLQHYHLPHQDVYMIMELYKESKSQVQPVHLQSQEGETR
jgi:hypothetical protein